MPTDYKYDPDYDLLIAHGDFVLAESTEQHQKDLILQNYGDDRLYPFIGVGIIKYINDDNFGDVKREIRKQFELDGMEVERLTVYEDGATDIKAIYP